VIRRETSATGDAGRQAEGGFRREGGAGGRQVARIQALLPRAEAVFLVVAAVAQLEAVEDLVVDVGAEGLEGVDRLAGTHAQQRGVAQGVAGL
jgi:hypothetical protein